MQQCCRPHWFQCGSGSSIFCHSGSGSCSESRSKVLMTKNWKKITAEIKFKFFWSKIAIYLPLGLYKGRPSYRRSFHPSKENLALQNLNFLHFCVSFWPVWIRIRILDADPDLADHNECGSENVNHHVENASLYFFYFVRKIDWERWFSDSIKMRIV